MVGSLTIAACPICGGADFAQSEILWRELIEDWELAPAEAAYVNQQQGLYIGLTKNSLAPRQCGQSGGHYSRLAIGFGSLLPSLEQKLTFVYVSGSKCGAARRSRIPPLGTT